MGAFGKLFILLRLIINFYFLILFYSNNKRGVGKASEHLPALVIISSAADIFADKKSICLIGKGIVYDTGGLSIKDR